jgi:hypothetical protein
MTQYYTNELRGDGFGANYQTLISAILLAEVYYKSEFVYTKPNLKNIYEDEADEYENIMNLSNCFKSINDIEDKNSVSIIEIQHSYNIINSNLDYYLKSDTMKKIRSMFKQNKITDILDKNYNHIAIHIRRPSCHKNIDISEEHNEGWDKTTMNIEQLCAYTRRFTTDNYFIDIINSIRQNNTSKKNIFHIFSESNDVNNIFNNFLGSNDIILHINEPVKETYIYMVMCDILVISKSAFSFTASLLTDNLVFNREIYFI